MSDSQTVVNLLRQGNGRLPRGSGDLDQWRSIWMMLVGTWYLLARADPHLVGPDQLDLGVAESFATDVLDGGAPPESEWVERFGPHPWISGFYVLSAEHRIANSIDRLSKVFAGARIDEISGGDQRSPYPRCKYLASQCPHCKGQKYLEHTPEASAILGAFTKGASSEWPTLRLSRVYKRVNELKHQPKPYRSRDATETRSRDAARALLEVSTVFAELALHRKECTGPFEPLHV